MRVYSGWIGMCCLAIGILSILPIENKLDRITSITLIIVGVILMFYGRKYLPGWIGNLFQSNDDES